MGMPRFLGHGFAVKHGIAPPLFRHNAPIDVPPVKAFATYPQEFLWEPVPEAEIEHTIFNHEAFYGAPAFPTVQKGFTKVVSKGVFRLRFKYVFVGLTINDTDRYGFGEYEYLLGLYSHRDLMAQYGLFLQPHAGDPEFRVIPMAGSLKQEYIEKKYWQYIGHLKSSYRVEIAFETQETYEEIPVDWI